MYTSKQNAKCRQTRLFNKQEEERTEKGQQNPSKNYCISGNFYWGLFLLQRATKRKVKGAGTLRPCTVARFAVETSRGY